MDSNRSPRVALFVTCLVELYRPAIAEAARQLVAATGAQVVIPKDQTCCGQPVYNAGDRRDARRIAKHTIKTLEAFEEVVVPSGSCAAMIVRHYPDLLEGETHWQPRADSLAAKTWELTDYLSRQDHSSETTPEHGAMGRLTFHDGCSGLRELGVKAQPRKLLGRATGQRLAEMAEAERCCGFGGLFCVKYDAISETMGTRKLDSAERCGAETLVAGELGCLLHLAGLARRQGRALHCRHVAEILAGCDNRPAIGESW